MACIAGPVRGMRIIRCRMRMRITGRAVGYGKYHAESIHGNPAEPDILVCGGNREQNIKTGKRSGQ